jgi:hypothetical protein
MSGPKTTEYYVSENELRCRQAVQDALQQTEALEKRYSDIKVKIITFDQNPLVRASKIDTSLSLSLTNRDDLTLIENYNSRLRDICVHLEEALTQQVAQQTFEANLQSELLEKASKKINSLLFTNHKNEETSKEIFERQRDQLRKSHSKQIFQKLQETVLRILARTPGDISLNERQKLESLASSILESKNSSEQDAYETELRYKVQLAIERSKKLNEDASIAAELLTQLRGYNSTEIQALIEELQRVERKEQPLSSTIKERVSAAHRRTKAESDRLYVENSISETLKELGYEVEEEFSTLFMSGSTVRLQKPDWDEYFVQFIFSQEENQINYNVVRLDDSNPSTENRQIRDSEMESLWCSDFKELNHILENRGIENRLIRQENIGSIPVAVIREAGALKSRSRSSKSSNKKNKSIG